MNENGLYTGLREAISPSGSRGAAPAQVVPIRNGAVESADLAAGPAIDQVESRLAAVEAELERRDEMLAEQQSELERLRGENSSQAALLDYFRARTGLQSAEDLAEDERGSDMALAAELAMCRARLQETEGELETALALVMTLRVEGSSLAQEPEESARSTLSST